MKECGRVSIFFLLLVLVTGQVSQVFADALPGSEITAVDNYPNWVGVCGSDISGLDTGASTGGAASGSTPDVKVTANGNTINPAAPIIQDLLSAQTATKVPASVLLAQGAYESGDAGWWDKSKVDDTKAKKFSYFNGGGKHNLNEAFSSYDTNPAGHGPMQLDNWPGSYGGSTGNYTPGRFDKFKQYAQAQFGAASSLDPTRIGNIAMMFDTSILYAAIIDAELLPSGIAPDKATPDQWAQVLDDYGTLRGASSSTKDAWKSLRQQITTQLGDASAGSTPSPETPASCCTTTTPVTAEGTSTVNLKSLVSKYNLQSAEVQKLGGNVIDSYMADSPPNTPASVLKLIIADAYLSTNPDLNRMLTIHANQLYGAGSVGEKRKASDVLTGMLSISDNTDANLLIDATGGFSTITHIARGLGYAHTDINNYYQASGGSNTTTVSDISKAMNKVYTASGPGYSIAQDALRTAATGSDNFYSVNDEANKWAGTQGTGGTPPVAGNSGVFNISGQKYIITLYINEPDTVGGKPNPKVAAASADIANQVIGSDTSTGPSVSSPSGSCCPSGSGDASLIGNDHVTQAFNFFTQTQGLTPFQAAVIVGTMMEESGHKLDATDVNGSSGAYGIAQWLGGRLTGLETFASNKTPPKDKSDFATQLGYVWQELGGSYKSTLDKLKSETDIDTAVYDFEATYEVSGHQLIPERQADAKQVLHDNGGGPDGGPAAATDCSGSSPGSSDISAYKNPLRDVQHLTQGRIDQGVDYTGSGSVYAMGDGTVINVTNSGWYGVGKVDAFIVYKLSAGPAAGKFVYFAENCTPKVSIGDKVYVGDGAHSATVICDMLADHSPSDPESIETGWADGTRIGDALAHDVWSGHDSTDYYTDAGKNYSDLLVKLSAPPGTIKSGAKELKVPLPSGWPTWK